MTRPRFGARIEWMGVTAAPQEQSVARGYPIRVAIAALLMGLVVLLLMWGDAVLYNRTEWYPPVGIAGLPPGSIIPATVAAGALGLLVFVWRPARTKALAIPFILVVAIVTAGATYLTVESVQGISVPAYVQQAPSAAVTRDAKQALRAAKSNGSCVVVRHRSLPIDLPIPYERCAYPSDTYSGPSEVDYFDTWQTLAANGYVYVAHGAVPNPVDMCRHHLSGPWWAAMGEAPTPIGCPHSFQAEGGG
jgi:hypothetical protein